MNNQKRKFILALVFFCLFGSANAQIIIPDNVKAVLEEGLESLEPRVDIPFEIIKHLILPAQANVHSVFIFKLKNPEVGTSLDELYKKGSVNFNVFLQFIKFIENAPPSVIQEIYISATFHVGRYAKQNDFYTAGYPLSPGDYILAMAIASEDFKLIGTQYFEFSLPDLVRSDFDITPIFFVNKLEQKESPETIANVHKNYFSYSILNIEPKIENLFSSVDTLDIFFFIYGIQSNSFQVKYDIYRDSKKVVDYQIQQYDSPLVSQQLPLLERHNLSPGLYTLAVDITDAISGRKIYKRVNFEIR